MVYILITSGIKWSEIVAKWSEGGVGYVFGIIRAHSRP